MITYNMALAVILGGKETAKAILRGDIDPYASPPAFRRVGDFIEIEAPSYEEAKTRFLVEMQAGELCKYQHLSEFDYVVIVVKNLIYGDLYDLIMVNCPELREIIRAYALARRGGNE